MVKFIMIRNNTKEVSVFETLTKALEHTQSLTSGDRYFIYDNKVLLAKGIIKQTEDMIYE